MIIPPALQNGAVVAIAAPGSSFEREKFERGIATVRAQGYQVIYDESIFDKQGFLAGSDERRAAELNRYFADPEVAAILCARGGYGSGRLYDKLDLVPLQKNPKIFVGYSDLTALHSLIWNKLGLVTFHGPLVVSDLAEESDRETPEILWRTLTGGANCSTITGGQTLRSGSARGRLLGGCLSLLVTTLGTVAEPDTAGAVLLLEDTNEGPYRIDRMLNHLHQAGKLQDVAGLVFGCFQGNECTEQDEKDTVQVLGEWAERLAVPAISGFPSGHSRPNFTLPLGIEVRLAAGECTIEFLEPAVEL
jgi:muramoyltetrapeptide carboxypeptidase